MIVYPRFCAAVAGYIQRFQTLPTSVLVPAQNFMEGLFYDGHVPHDSPIVRELLLRLTIVPFPHQNYIALGPSSQSYEYGEQGPPEEVDVQAFLSEWLHDHRNSFENDLLNRLQSPNH